MPMAHVRKVGGENDLYHIHFLDQHGGGHPDQGLPGQGGLHPGNRPPGSGGGGHPDQGLPGGGGHPSHPIHGGGRPGIPDNSLPEAPPPQLLPGYTLVMVRGQDGKWKYAAVAPGSPPPRPLPEPIPPGGAPDQGLPPQGSGGQPDQGLPGGQPAPTPQSRPR